MVCRHCATENPPASRFCGGCGAELSRVCGACAAANDPSMLFCNQCGSALAGEEVRATEPPTAEPAHVEPASERRLVSVLFADLVGFTTLSESRDAEDVRALLSGYFETCRRLIERYGGAVEKFIGDAVMAVWGAPVAKEDDAERAVRAALDLVQAVADLGAEVGAPDLAARAGVFTGEAAVRLNGGSEGLVAGDVVNTASRVQSVAEPGTVLVGEPTKRASEAAIAYQDTGSRELKGKSEPVPLWQALRVVGGRGGTLRSVGLEAPFVGRDRELRLVKDLLHASAEEGKAHVVSVVGTAGVGKTRLSWEFEKYADGLATDFFWHQSRCLSYGDGVAYWALAEMVRARCGMVEEEESKSALEKLRAATAEHIPDPEERRWVEPRLAHLLGLEEGATGDEENLFPAWRIFFERLAGQSPTILVFEDMQWADDGLLDFLEYLVEWSRNLPVFVLVLARPELMDKRPAWGAGKRSFTSLYLEALPPQAMNNLLTGLAPGLPKDLQTSILGHAEGIPLYAVETVRMLLDRGLLSRNGNVYLPTGAIETLAVPETLHALIAARLDSLTPEERRLVEDASVLGKTFTKQGLAALTGLSEAESEPLLSALVRKEVLTIQADPLSPERGQYSFLQEIVKRVAYETISKKERKTKHVAAARFLTSVSVADEDEITEVLAAHYIDAYEAAPEDPDAPEIRSKAREMLVRAGERAASLAATSEAQRAFERAIELTDDPVVEAELRERAGMAAEAGARTDAAAAHFERAIELFEAAKALRPRARVSARLAEIMWERGRLEQGLEGMEQALAVLSRDDEEVAMLAAQLGRFMFFAGDTDLSAQRIEMALEMAEALSLPEVLSQALNTKALILFSRGRRREGAILCRYALDVALEHDKPSAALRAFHNLADLSCDEDRYEDAARLVREGLAHARKVGNRAWEWTALTFGYPFYALGEWDEALAMRADVPEGSRSQVRVTAESALISAVPIAVHRGRLEDARRMVNDADELASSADVQDRAIYWFNSATVLLGSGNAAKALASAEAAFDHRESLPAGQEVIKESFVVAVQAALALDRLDKAEELLALVEGLPPGQRTQFYNAHIARFRAQLAARRGESDEADRLFKGAGGLFHELAMPLLPCRHTARARRVARLPRPRGRGRAAARRGQADLRTAPSGAVARASRADVFGRRARLRAAGSGELRHLA
jgi:class 3 adenylate cyclase/predicted ATPase